ncbi:MAG: tyrosine-protein kinase [Frankiales bacterium]|nr:tyrosine-protein kinase [Frankiales bacterium]
MSTYDVTPPPTAGGGAFVRTYALLMAGVTALFTLGAGGYAALQQPQYTSTTRVLVEPLVAPGAVVHAPDMGTERAIVTSGEVITRAAQLIGTGQGDVSGGLSVTVPVDTNVLSIAASSSSPAVAQQEAKAVAQAYVQFRNSQNKPPPGVEGVPGERTSVITAAFLPRSPSSPNYVLDIVAGLLLGSTVGLLLALGVDRFGSKVRTRALWQAVAGAPVLMSLPREAFAADPAGPLPSRLAERFRYLRLKVVQLVPGNRTVLVTSVTDHPAKPLTAFRLAEALAYAGQRTALFCIDPGNPWGGPDLVGVQESGDLVQSGPIAIRTTVSARYPLLVLAAIQTATPPEHLTYARLSASLSALHKLADYVVLDAPPMSHSTLVLDLARVADAAVLVDNRVSSRRDVGYAVQELRSAGCRLAGGVLADPPTMRARRRLARSAQGDPRKHGQSLQRAVAPGPSPQSDSMAARRDEPS